MAQYGQPESFSVKLIHPTETPPAGASIPPDNILQVGDTLKLRTYFEFSGTNGFERNAVFTALAGAPTVTYYFDDLAAGGTPIQVSGGPIIKLAVLDAQAQADLKIAVYDLVNKDLYRSADTVAITTGAFASGQTLTLPAATATQGCWQVSVVLNGANPMFKVCAFSSEMLVVIFKP